MIAMAGWDAKVKFLLEFCQLSIAVDHQKSHYYLRLRHPYRGRIYALLIIGSHSLSMHINVRLDSSQREAILSY